MSVVYKRGPRSLDGINPPHAVDTSGKAIPESSATQPDKPFSCRKTATTQSGASLSLRLPSIIQAQYRCEHTLDGRPRPPAFIVINRAANARSWTPYLKKSERTKVLTTAQLDTSKQAVNSCRKCHFRTLAKRPASFHPRRHLSERDGQTAVSKVDYDNAYHTKCISCQ